MPDAANIPGRQPLTIGFVLDDSLDPPDGVQQYVLTIGEWMRSKGHDVHYLTSTTTRTDIANIHSLTRNKVVSFNGNRMRVPLPVRRSNVRMLLEQEKFDVLHIQMPYSPLLAGRIIQAAGRRTAVVGTFHVVPKSGLVGLASRVLAVWCRSTLRRFDAAVSVSGVAQTFARKVFGLDSVVLPNAVPLDNFIGAHAAHRPEGKGLHIVFLGRLVERKGCRLLLQAVNILNRMGAVPPFHVSVCGKGPLQSQLEAYVDRRGLRGHVTFTGFIPEQDKPSWLASADIAVFPSNGGESFGIVLVEAMASGRAAVVAGNNDGYRTILAACPENVLFNPQDASELAARLLAIMSDVQLRTRIARWGAEHVRQFDVARVGEQLSEIYRSALRRRLGIG